MAWGLQGVRIPPMVSASRATTLAIVSATDLGLSINVPTAGVWNISGYLPIVNVGSPTNTSVNIAGPAVAADWVVAITKYNAAIPTATYYRTTAAALSIAGTTTQATCNLITVSGALRFTSTGTISITGTRNGGTSQTLQIGAYLSITRVA